VHEVPVLPTYRDGSRLLFSRPDSAVSRHKIVGHRGIVDSFDSLVSTPVSCGGPDVPD
jgi:hypothetical protein